VRVIDDHGSPSAGGSIGYQIAIVTALLSGAALCAGFGDRAQWTAPELAPFGVAILLGLIPTVRRKVLGWMECCRRPSARTRAMVCVGLFLISFAVSILPPLLSGRTFYPRSHDEQAYAVMVRMMSDGRLWMPPHPLGEFFDSFYILVRPVYAAAYFAGAGMMLVPSVWLHLPFWFLPVTYSAGSVILMYLVLTRLLGGAWGLLGAGLLLGNTDFRTMALVWMPHNLMLLLGLGMLAAWLRWMDRRTAGWSALAGAIAGLAAITRPLDALCYGAPLALAGLPALGKLSLRQKATTIIAVLICAAPFLAIQIYFNIGVSGRASISAYQMYVDRDQPNSGYGFPPYDPALWPQSQVMQKSIYYDQFIRPELKEHRPDRVWRVFLNERLPLMMRITLSHPLLVLLLPISILGLIEIRRAAVWSVLPILTVAYTPFPFLLGHYLVVWLAPVIFAIVLGADVLVRGFPRQRWLSAMIPLLVLAAIVSGQAPLNPGAVEPWKAPLMDDVHRQLAHLPHLPAVVLFRYDPRTGIDQEPVYNYQAAWPDDEPIIRAHDLGPENVKIIDYYARTQPQRFFYRYDRLTRTLEPLGYARELVRRIRMQPGTTSAPAASSRPVHRSSLDEMPHLINRPGDSTHSHQRVDSHFLHRP
jgi:hypothetical protein